MAFKEEGSVEYITVDGKEVPVVKCEAEIVLRNTKTNYEYNSDKEAEDDIANPETDKVASMNREPPCHFKKTSQRHPNLPGLLGPIFFSFHFPWSICLITKPEEGRLC